MAKRPRKRPLRFAWFCVAKRPPLISPLFPLLYCRRTCVARSGMTYPRYLGCARNRLPQSNPLPYVPLQTRLKSRKKSLVTAPLPPAENQSSCLTDSTATDSPIAQSPDGVQRVRHRRAWLIRRPLVDLPPIWLCRFEGPGAVCPRSPFPRRWLEGGWLGGPMRRRSVPFRPPPAVGSQWASERGVCFLYGSRSVAMYNIVLHASVSDCNNIVNFLDWTGRLSRKSARSTPPLLLSFPSSSFRKKKNPPPHIFPCQVRNCIHHETRDLLPPTLPYPTLLLPTPPTLCCRITLAAYKGLGATQCDGFHCGLPTYPSGWLCLMAPGGLGWAVSYMYTTCS
ncbi:hypothetical protein HDK77DRAFT_225324 [Phyllosticta capitalensis]